MAGSLPKENRGDKGLSSVPLRFRSVDFGAGAEGFLPKGWKRVKISEEEKENTDQGEYYYRNDSLNKSVWTIQEVLNISEKDDTETLEDEEDEVTKTRTLLESLRHSDSATLRKLLVVLFGLVIGGGAIAVTYFLFPAAIATIVTLLGLTGPLALIVPLVAVGLIGALFGAELLAFLEQRFLDTNRLNHNFMRNLVIFCAVVAGIALGIFIVASTPAVLGLLSFATAIPVIGVALPYVIAGAASLLVTGAIGYALYRASGMQKRQWHRDIRQVIEAYKQAARAMPKKPDQAVSSKLISLQEAHSTFLQEAAALLKADNPFKAPTLTKLLDLLELGIKRGYPKEDLQRALVHVTAIYKDMHEDGEEEIFVPLAEAISNGEKVSWLTLLSEVRDPLGAVRGQLTLVLKGTKSESVRPSGDIIDESKMELNHGLDLHASLYGSVFQKDIGEGNLDLSRLDSSVLTGHTHDQSASASGTPGDSTPKQ